MSKQTILIIGGGSAGVGVAQGLSQKLDSALFNVIIVTERTFHVHYPPLLRVLVTSEGNFQDLALTPYDKVFQPGRPGEVIVGSVEKLEDGLATLASGQKINYDWLVLATGTIWEGPLVFPQSLDEAHKWISEWRTKFGSAKKVVLVGGGSVGVELAGEIRHFHPEVEVTIVHAGESLFSDAYPNKFRNSMLDSVRDKGIKVILGDRVDLTTQVDSLTTITTSKGVKLETDLVIPTRGGRPNTALLKTFDASVLTAQQTVKVLPTLRVPLSNGRGNVWALGDIIDWKEQKGLAKVPPQIATVTANILNVVNKREGNQHYGGFMDALSVPLGPNGGRTYIPKLWGLVLGDWLTSKLKSKHLFADKGRQQLGY